MLSCAEGAVPHFRPRQQVFVTDSQRCWGVLAAKIERKEQVALASDIFDL